VLVELAEYGPAREARLTSDTAAALATTRLVETRPTERPGCWSLVPRGRVGSVQAGGVSVHVAPKVSIGRLMFLLEYAPERIAWQREQVELDEHADLLQVVATVFSRTADVATRGGLLQGYVVVEESLPVVRGRIREAEQMRLRQGRMLPVEVRYDDFTVDIAENQLLQAATCRLLQLPALRPQTRHHLMLLRQRMAEVSPLIRGASLPRWAPSRLNIRYQPALRLAELVLAGTSFEHRVGSLPVHGFVLNMPKVFEDFLTKALRAALQPVGGQVRAQKTVPLDEDHLIRTQPDIVWMDGQRPLAVIDAKYKAEKPEGFPDADIYQALAYATALHLPDAHLVYAKGNEDAQSYTVLHAGTRITAHTLDLNKPATALLHQVGQLAAGIAERASSV
jgi:5-methylcytosine-specific restriction enzyme subunit McrC